MKTTIKKSELKKMSVLNLIEQVVIFTDDSESLDVPSCAEPYVSEIAQRLNLTSRQALFLSVFVNQSDDNSIQPRDLARHFGVKTISILAATDDIDALVRLNAVRRRKDSDGDILYRVPQETIKSLREGKLPDQPRYENLTANEWIAQVSDSISMRKREEIEDSELNLILDELIEKNRHLGMVEKIRSFNFCYSDLLLYLVMSLCFIENHDDRIQRSDIDDYFIRHRLQSHISNLEAGEHILQANRLIEFSCVDGQIESDSWCLTNYSKKEIYSELNLQVSKNSVRSNLTRPEDIAEKTLFYTQRVKKEVERLGSLLAPSRMADVMRRLGEKGMRRGFTCLFYGGPGTGKTETALQLAKASGRDLMIVDVPSIRSKWVGETEKNIKDLFDRYRHSAANNDKAPILLFNEADALLNRRKEGSTGSVDKMENAMQNIILQEMENLEGIMIATTNLTGSLDPAFERRFLYKIEFEKPSANERSLIWKEMLPDLTSADALSLAQRFEFSGGQIENIARKRIIDDILNGNDHLDLQSIIDSCQVEQLTKTAKSTHIGFAV